MSLSEYAAEPFNIGKDFRAVAQAYANGRRCNWTLPPCVKVDYENSPENLNRYLSKYVGKQAAGSDNIVQGRVWSASTAVRTVCETLRTDSEFCTFWYNAGVQILKRKEYVEDFFSICKCRLTSIFAWFPDVKEYVSDRISELFTPCPYYQRSLGLYPE